MDEGFGSAVNACVRCIYSRWRHCP